MLKMHPGDMSLQLWCYRHKLQCHKQQILRQKVPREKKKGTQNNVFNLSTNVWLLSMSTSHPPTTSAAANRTCLCPSFKPQYFINLSMNNQMIRYGANSSSETLLFVLDYKLHPTVSMRIFLVDYIIQPNIMQTLTCQ